MSKWKRALWVVGGMALGLGIALILGLLIFWAWPAYRKAKSPLGEVETGAVTVRYLKRSAIAEEVRSLAAEIARDWEEVVDRLGIPPKGLPERIYVYLYHQPDELLTAFSIRLREEITPLAVVDVLAPGPIRGALTRLACSLAYGKPGNPFFPRGLALYMERPGVFWAAEAAAYGVTRHWEALFQFPDKLLRRDPWEQLYFQVDAPWASFTPSLEALRALFSAASANYPGAPAWEALAAAFAQFIFESFGTRGIKAFWCAPTWEKGVRSLNVDLEEFKARWEEVLAEGAARAAADPLLAAKGALFAGKPEEALAHLGAMAGAEANKLRGMAYLALGDPNRALSYLKDTPVGDALSEIIATSAVQVGSLIVFGPPEEVQQEVLFQAYRAMKRALEFWPISEDRLPEKLVVYLSDPPQKVQLPWGVIWQKANSRDLPKVLVRFVLGLLSPLGLPSFDALVEGLVMTFAYPSRDFVAEARSLLSGGRWISLTQSFSDYPASIAEVEAGAFVAFLLDRFGTEKIKELWDMSVAGASPYRASLEVLGMDLPSLDQAFKAWVTQP